MELYIPHERPQRRPDGKLLPGHKGYTRGRKRTEFMSEETDRRLKELGAKMFREQKHPENAGVPKRKVVLVADDGRFCVFPSILEAAKKIGGNATNIGRCCRQNARKRVKKRTWTKTMTKESGSLINTNHRYMGFRFYFEDDETWITKIRQ